MKLFFLPLRLDPCFSLKLELIFYNLELWDRDKLRGKKEVNEEVKSIANPIFLSQMQSNPSKAFSRFKYYLGIQESAKETDLKKKLGWKNQGMWRKTERRKENKRWQVFSILNCLVSCLYFEGIKNWKLKVPSQAQKPFCSHISDKLNSFTHSHAHRPVY